MVSARWSRFSHHLSPGDLQSRALHLLQHKADESSDDLYVTLRSSLLDRSRDKDTAVRVQAALGLAKLQDGEDEEDLEEGEESLAQVLLDLLRYDPAA